MKRLALFLLRSCGYRGTSIDGVIFLAHKDSYKKTMGFKTRFFCDGVTCAVSPEHTDIWRTRNRKKQYTPEIKIELE